MIKHFLNSKSKNFTFAAFLLGTSSLISAFLGLIRDRLLAGRFGASGYSGGVLDVYFAAFRIPDLIYGILITGGIVATFLPIFSDYFSKNQEQGWKLANNVLNILFFFLLIFCGLLFIFAPLVVNLIAPGFLLEQKLFTVLLTRIMLLSPILLGASSIFSGILQYFDRFFSYCLAPIFYNLGIILGIVFFVPLNGTLSYENLLGVSYGVVLGALLHFLVQIYPVISSGYRYQFLINFKDAGVRRIFKLMIPRIIGQASIQINLFVITAIASTLAMGSIAIFNFSNHIQAIPLSLIGISFAVAVFPSFSRSWANGEKKEFLNNFSLAFRQIIFFTIPLSVLMFLLRAQIVRVILGTGEFGWLETRLTAASLGIFCFGIFASSLIPLLARAFFSFQDTKTPVLISISSVCLNILLAFFFVGLLKGNTSFYILASYFLKLKSIENIQIIGLPLALTFSAVFQFIVLFFILNKKIRFNRLEIFDSFVRIFSASMISGIFTYFALNIVSLFIIKETFFTILMQLSIAGIFGISVYFFLCWLFDFTEMKSIFSGILKQFRHEPRN